MTRVFNKSVFMHLRKWQYNADPQKKLALVYNDITSTGH